MKILISPRAALASILLMLLMLLMMSACAQPEPPVAPEVSTPQGEPGFTDQSSLPAASPSLPTVTETALPVTVTIPLSGTEAFPYETSPAEVLMTPLSALAGEQAASVIPGLIRLPYPQAPDYTLRLDPAAWQLNSGANLASDPVLALHRRFHGCTIQLVSSATEGEQAGSSAVTIEQLGRLRFQVQAANGLFTLPDDPLFPGLLLTTRDDQCRTEQLKALATLDKLATPTPVPPTLEPGLTSTPSPTPVVCTQAPPSRVSVGITVTVISDVVIRASPKYVSNNVIRHMKLGERVQIIAGPACGAYPGGQYLYWKVLFVDPQTNKELTGWMAEGLPDKYFIAP